MRRFTKAALILAAVLSVLLAGCAYAIRFIKLSGPWTISSSEQTTTYDCEIDFSILGVVYFEGNYFEGGTTQRTEAKYDPNSKTYHGDFFTLRKESRTLVLHVSENTSTENKRIVEFNLRPVDPEPNLNFGQTRVTQLPAGVDAD